MSRFLIVVDMQNDFVSGSLGTKEARFILPAVVEKIHKYRDQDKKVLFTLDTHYSDYLDTQEGKHLPVEHCIRGSWGWELAPEIIASYPREKCRIYEKPTFASLKLANNLLAGEEGNFDSIELVGLCTDICVVSNALLLKAQMPEIPIYVDPNCCAGTTVANHLAALDTMRACQICVESA